MLSRRQLLTGGVGAAGAGALGFGAFQLAPERYKDRLGLLPDPYIPDAHNGKVRLQRMQSEAMGGELDLFTAVPAGHGSGGGLPVVVIMHGSSASAAKLRGFGLGRFLTRAVQLGAPPFVLAGTDDGPNGWVPDGPTDPRRMLMEELPGWLEDRGFDAGRRAVWGWSRGGYGALGLVEAEPRWARAAALFSPALSQGDPLFAGLSAIRDLPLGVWCGTDDPFYPAVRELVDEMPRRPQVVSFTDGAHTRRFWNDHTLEAFTWLADQLNASE